MATTRLGLCSNYLSRLQEGDVVLVKIRPGTFRYFYSAIVHLIGNKNFEIQGLQNLKLS